MALSVGVGVWGCVCTHTHTSGHQVVKKMTQSDRVPVLSGKDIEDQCPIAGTFASFVMSDRRTFQVHCHGKFKVYCPYLKFKAKKL